MINKGFKFYHFHENIFKMVKFFDRNATDLGIELSSIELIIIELNCNYKGNQEELMEVFIR